MSTVDRFKDALKIKLRDGSTFVYTDGTDTQGYGGYVDWPELERQIDEFAAEFQKGKT